MITLLLCALAQADDLPAWSFEDGEAGFIAESGLQWQWGLNSMGQWGWSTRLGGLYLNDATDRLTVPVFEITRTVRPLLRLQHEFDIDQTGRGDAGWIEGFMGDEWVRIDPVYGYPADTGFTGTSDGLQWNWFDLSAVESPARLRFVFESDNAVRRSGWFIKNVKVEDGDPIPPLIQSVTEPPDTTDVTRPYALSADIIDDMHIDWVDVHWTTNNEEEASSPMSQMEDTLYTGFIPAQDPGTVVMWWIEASDGSNLTRWPESGEAQFSVRLPPPTDVHTEPGLPNGRIADTQVEIRWSAPDTDQEIAGYSVERNGVEIETPSTEEATIRLVDGLQTISVRGVFSINGEQFTGEASDGLDLDVSLPRFRSIQPNHAWPEDFLRVTVAGDNLYLDASNCTLLPGPGISVESFEVVDAHTARGLLHIEANATPGTRTFVLKNGSMDIEAEIDFRIQSEGDRPIVLGAHPTTVRQGARTNIFLDMSSPADSSKPPPIVDLGEGIIIENVVRRSTGLDVTLSVAHDAPLGDRDIEVDEGDRIITGASIEVRDTPKVPRRNCAASSRSSSNSFEWWIAIALLAGRRRTTTSTSHVRDPKL